MNNGKIKKEEEKDINSHDYGDLYNEDKLHNPIKNVSEKWKLIPAFLKVRGLVKQHIDSFNHFINIGIKELVKAKSNYMITSDYDPKFYLKYKDIYVEKPTIYEDFVTRLIYPHECRVRNLTYAANIFVDIEYTCEDRCISRNSIVIGQIPIMLGSSNCNLIGKTHDDLALLNECPYDPRGYFIVKGVEKVILIHEQLSNNRIIVEKDKKGNLFAQVKSITMEKKTLTGLNIKHGKAYLSSNSFNNDIPLVIVFRAMGILSDMEIIQLIGSEFYDMIILSIEEAHSLNVLNREQAIEYIGTKTKSFGKKSDMFENVIEVLSTIVLAHIPVVKGNFFPKTRYLSFMARRLFECLNDPTMIDDKDYYGNKRLELDGQLISLLFEDLFKKFNSDLKKQADMLIGKGETFDIVKHIHIDTITHGLSSAISSGNWTVKRFRMSRQGVTQVLNRLSYISALGYMTKITSQFEKTRKISGPRSLQPSQWGMICPSDTPEGESCGLDKNLALLSHVTTSQPHKAILNLSINLGLEDIGLLTGEEIYSKQNYLIFLNGEPIGSHKHPNTFVKRFRSYRRKGLIHEFVSISKNDAQRNIFIASDSGRLTRPLIIVENKKSKLTAQDINLISLEIKSFKDLVQGGVIEYLDVNEENDALIALTEQQITVGTTHLEIAPFSILGVVAGLIPFPNHNQAARNTFQCAMGKQAIGTMGYNQLNRFDTILYLMVYPQIPLVKTITIELVNYDKLPAGQNASVAIMSFSGYDIEDAVIMNKASLDRGFGRVMVKKRYQEELKKSSAGLNEYRKCPEKFSVDKDSSNYTKKKNISHIQKKLRPLDRDGLPYIGERLFNGDIYINKYSIINQEGDYTQNNVNIIEKPSMITYKSTVSSYVDRVMLTTTPNQPELIKVILRQTRRPEIGDKFSSRHGQKGVVGLIVNQEDMPFSETGWCPDLIMNPHGFPSRMTVGKLIELLAGKSAVMDGVFKYGTAFAGEKVDDIGKILVQNGFSSTGKDFLMSGITGEYIECAIYSGPIFYQRLKHMVVDKMHARATGPRTSLTRQPTEGRAKDGGLRLGEMERDCFIGYGASNLLLERLMISSDVFKVFICSRCGFIAYQNHCTYCNDGEKIFTIKLPYAFKLLIHELLSMNIKTKFNLTNL